MELTNFALVGDGISLAWDGRELDLHNEFTFHALNYFPALRWLQLTWTHATTEAAENAAPNSLTLLFRDVTFFRLKERAAAYPFTEDDCLTNISFHPVAARNEFNSIHPTATAGADLTFLFVSEWGLKVNAATAELTVL